jgi:hypothetical protein
MASAKGIISKLDAALKKVSAYSRAVYKRTTVRDGGDDLIGSPGSITHRDTLLDPPPVYTRLGRNVVGDFATATTLISSDGSSRQVANDYSILLSPTDITEQELTNPDVSIVFKDNAGKIEVFSITDYEPVAFQTENVMYLAYIRSVQRSEGTG